MEFKMTPTNEEMGLFRTENTDPNTIIHSRHNHRRKHRESVSPARFTPDKIQEAVRSYADFLHMLVS
jgi:hypothetical protein